jgi:hypothetical protein
MGRQMNIVGRSCQSAILFGSVLCSSGASGEENKGIVVEAGPVCGTSDPFSESVSTLYVNPNEPADPTASRSYRFGFRKFLCNTGDVTIQVKSLNGGRVRIREGERASEAVQNPSHKSHYKVRGELGVIELPVLDTSQGKHIEYDLPGAYIGSLEFTIEFANEESAPKGRIYHDVLRIGIGPDL